MELTEVVDDDLEDMLNTFLGLLYSEIGIGMNNITLYLILPCGLGLT